MALSLVSFALLVMPLMVFAQNHVVFDRASASSVYSSGGFSAGQALAESSGYWCRFVICDSLESAAARKLFLQCWQSYVRADRNVDGRFGYSPRRDGHRIKLVMLSFVGYVACLFNCFFRAYGPGEIQILISSDGGNFEEAACWRAAARSEVSYRETIMFERAQRVKAVSIVMKSPMSWGYFGLNDVKLLTTGDEAFMIISGERSAEGEQCLTVSGSEILVENCLDSLASADQREVFKFREQRVIHSASGMCVVAVGADAYQIALQECNFASGAHEVRSAWELTAKAQLKLSRMGDYCLTFQGGRASVGDCGASFDKFFLAAVPEADVGSSAAVTSGAKLLAASAARQRAALNNLRELVPALDSCKFLSLSKNITRRTNVHNTFQLNAESFSFSTSSRSDIAALTAIGKVYEAVGIDLADVLRLISESSNVLAEVHAKVAKSA